LYIGNSKLISSFNKGICGGVLPCPFGEFGRGCEMVEEEEDGGEGGGEAPFHPVEGKSPCGQVDLLKELDS
jgi:hypothetical protein